MAIALKALHSENGGKERHQKIKVMNDEELSLKNVRQQGASSAFHRILARFVKIGSDARIYFHPKLPAQGCKWKGTAAVGVNYFIQSIYELSYPF